MAGLVAGGLFNAIAFAGAGYIFHKLDKSGYEKEMKRHDEAMEKLSVEKEKWYEKTVEKKNEHDRITSTKIKRCEQRLRRYERSVTQIKIGDGRFRRSRRNRTEIKRLLRTFRRYENVYERRNRRDRIRVRIFDH